MHTVEIIEINGELGFIIPDDLVDKLCGENDTILCEEKDGSFFLKKL